MPIETKRHPCNTCGGATEHETIIVNRIEEVDSENKTLVRYINTINCRGCKSASIFEEIHAIEGVSSRYTPPRLWLQRPNWVDDIETIDNNIYGLLVEVYSAANDKQFRLLAMGVRAALDLIMIHILGDIGGFEQKLDKMVTEGHISKNQKEMLTTVIDAGSATAHRGYKPPKNLLVQMITIMEVIIQQYYITGPMLKTLKTIIPPRPSNTKK